MAGKGKGMGKVIGKGKGRERKAEVIDWPFESFGRCLNWNHCHNENVMLANGACVDCWDQGMGKPLSVPRAVSAFRTLGETFDHDGGFLTPEEFRHELMEGMVKRV